MGKIEDCDLFINSTSVGLKKDDNLGLNFDNLKKGKIFYDVIYNPIKTNFLIEAEKKGHKIINGMNMFCIKLKKLFIYGILTPEVNDELINYLYND